MTRTAAFFDIDRTLVVPTSMERMFLPYMLKSQFLGGADLARYLGFVLCNFSDLPQAFHQSRQHLRHKDPEALDELAARFFRERVRGHISPKGRLAVENHRRQGHLIVLVTGSLEPLARQMSRELGADLAFCSRLEVERGALSGRLANIRPYGPEKARLARLAAAEHHIDLAASFAYGDHHSDRHLLDAVGNPRAVNPDSGLRRLAEARSWPILSFDLE